MAEAVAALYAVETAVEGAAVGAVALAQSTAPLHLSFRKIQSPTQGRGLARSGHTVNVVRGKVYLIGGDGQNGEDGTIATLTLPVASSTGGEGTLEPQDFQIVSPEFKSLERPLARQTLSGADGSRGGDFNRIGHSSTAIDDKLFVVGGGSSSGGSAHSLDKFVVFDTLTSSYSILEADISSCVDGIPPPRTNHSATASPFPTPSSLPDGPTVDAHGTVFIHGGRCTDVDTSHFKTLRDTWAFDIGTRVWAKLPDIPDPCPLEIAGEGRIVNVNNRLWRLGDGFGRVMYIDLNGSHSSGAGSQISIALKTGVKWEVVNFGTEATDGASQGKMSSEPATTSSQPVSLPLPRVSSGVVPITTGSGREHLIYFMGRDSVIGPLDDFWSFQIDADKNTAASVKDKIRDAVAANSTSSWKSGRHTWAKCEQKKEEKQESRDAVAMWPPGLYDFGSDVWSDQGRDVFLIWGGKNRGHEGSQEEVVDGGWVVTVK
ncbi:uncharacterized protein A1O9_07566 [Exophiala aquamarina CBS 119918]|uniref:Uncharacterized protein n=1 Tax=Exophiala aquamarina CBS 119918 TaxID=1182545 RepID=A0A072P800_9EURO|nr:uncharacterized protein A1O9_07566 [Exophiala aquamarina CBS 119918]KEF55986.1 hypothetical protein A1O9_07566 [Exophiala aquamarina CBS 119918]